MRIVGPWKPPKYRAIPVRIDGLYFGSKKEAHRYQELKLLERAGEIWALEIHPRYHLHVHKERLGTYVADFYYHDVTGRVVEDVKGVITPLAKWKIRHFELQYQIKVKII